MLTAALRLWRARGWGAGGLAPPPTCLVCRDIDHGGPAGLRAQVGHAVDRLDPEGVVHVGQQVGHQEAGLHQAGLLGHEAGAAPARLAVAQGPGAAAAHGVVGDVAAAAPVQGRGPLQGHRRPIHAGDQIHRGRGGPWGVQKDRRAWWVFIWTGLVSPTRSGKGCGSPRSLGLPRDEGTLTASSGSSRRAQVVPLPSDGSASQTCHPELGRGCIQQCPWVRRSRHLPPTLHSAP